MFAKLYKKQRKKHDVLFSAVLGESERDTTFKRHRFIYTRLLASIRESQLANVQALYNFWHKVRYVLHVNKFSAIECRNIFNTIGRNIPRPRRIVGSERGIYFMFYEKCHTHRGRRKC